MGNTKNDVITNSKMDANLQYNNKSKMGCSGCKSSRLQDIETSVQAGE